MSEVGTGPGVLMYSVEVTVTVTVTMAAEVSITAGALGVPVAGTVIVEKELRGACPCLWKVCGRRRRTLVGVVDAGAVVAATWISVGAKSAVARVRTRYVAIALMATLVR